MKNIESTTIDLAATTSKTLTATKRGSIQLLLKRGGGIHGQCQGAQEATWLRQLLCDLGHRQTDPTTVWCDNQSCIALSKNPVFHARTKHVAVHYHFVRQAQLDGITCLRWVESAKNLADGLTKALSCKLLNSFASKISGDRLEGGC